MHFTFVCPILGSLSKPHINGMHIKNIEDVIVLPEDRSMTIPYEWDGQHLKSKGKTVKKTISTFPATLKDLRDNPQNHKLIAYTTTCPTGAYSSVILQTCD
jgi:hypothetical protein